MATARDLINRAMRAAGILGVGQTASAEDMNDAFATANGMLDEWNGTQQMMYTQVDTAFQSTGAQSYTIGIGQQFNVARPFKIQSAFARQFATPQPADYPLNVIQTQDEYNGIFLKQLPAFPAYIFYDYGWPNGKLYPWPIISSQFEIHVTTIVPLPRFANLSDQIAMPEMYEQCFRLSLAELLCIEWNLPAPTQLVQAASRSRAAVKRANTRTPTMGMPAPLAGDTRYNIYGDTVR